MSEQLQLKFDDGEILMEKKDVFIYTVPMNNTRKSGYHRASDWDTSNPNGTSNLIISTAGDCCHIQLEGMDGHVFGQSVVAFYPSRCGTLSALNPVADSSRYFTLKLQQNSGPNDLIGLGFMTHKDSTDVTETLENFFASHEQLIKAEVKVPKVESEAKVDTHTKPEAVEHKLEKKLPRAMLNKLENGHIKKEEKSTNLKIESPGSAHANEVKCEIVKEEKRSPVLSSTEKQHTSENDTLDRGSETGCALSSPPTSEVEIPLTPDLQQASATLTVEPEQASSFSTSDMNRSSTSARTSRRRRRKRRILTSFSVDSSGVLSSSDVLQLDEDQIQPSPKSRPKLSSVTSTAEPNQTFPNNNNDSSEITAENSVEGAQEKDTSWVLTKKLGLVDITGDTEDSEDTILAFRYRARGFGFKCHLCPLIISSSESSRKPIFTHWAEVHGFDKPYICGRCALLFYSKRKVVENNLLEIIRCLQCSSLLDGILRRDGFLKHMQHPFPLVESHYYLNRSEPSDPGQEQTSSESAHKLVPLNTEATEPDPIQNSQDRGSKNKFIIRPIKRSIRIQNMKLRELQSKSNRHPCNGSNNDVDLDTSGADKAQETTTEAPVPMDTDTDPLSMTPSAMYPDPDVTTLNSDPITSDKVSPELETLEWKSNLDDIRILRIPIGYELCQPGNVPTCYFCRLVINNSNISERCTMNRRKLVGRMEFRFICNYCSFNSEAPENQDNEFMHSLRCPHCPAKLEHEGALVYHLFAVHDEI